MIRVYQGPYLFDKGVLTKWPNQSIGVYYCGYLRPDGSFITLYVGKACSEGGIRGRLLQHVTELKWPDVTHFGYKICDFEGETCAHETTEIVRLQPKYNKIGK